MTTMAAARSYRAHIASTGARAAGSFEKGAASGAAGAVSNSRERGLLREIGGLADQVRELRRTSDRRNNAQIRLLATNLGTKWDEMRALRAPSVTADMPPLRAAHYD